MNKIASFFEAHIEKIILVIVGGVCVWLMITRVIFSPNQVLYEGAKYSPSAIDQQVYEQAQQLRHKINSPPEGLEPYKPKLPEYLALLDSSLKNVDVNLWPPIPYAVSPTTNESGAIGGKYNLPVVGPVSDVEVEHIRAAAYVPTVAVTAENQYSKAENEPNDIDLVTVQAKFDVEQLYNRFKHSFVDDVAEQFADPCLAKPVFAAVQLQRQELNKDGTWSDWKNIPRAKIDHYGALFDIGEDADKLPPGWLNVRKLQFDNWQLQIDLLQPEAYSIASAKEEWYPPVIHRQYLDIQRKEDAEEKRQAREDEQNTGDRTDSRRRRNDSTGINTGARNSRRTRGTSDIGGAGLYGGVGGDTSRRRSSRGGRTGTTYDSGMGMGTGMAGANDRRRGRDSRITEPGLGPAMGDYAMPGMPGMPGDRLARRGPSMNDVYLEFDKIHLTALTDLGKMKESLVFWAHDDTVEPRKNYRYRIRLGVFNPVAGTDQISREDISQKNDVVLWSEFSDITDMVEIPGRMYFFAKHIREPANVVTVQVSKYKLGYWYSEDFKVSNGETIGTVVEIETEDQNQQRRMPELDRMMTDTRMMNPMAMTMTRPREQSVVPDTIDFGTGAVMVNVVPVNDWSGDNTLTARHYYSMLYSMDGTEIEHMPVRTSYWAKELQDMYGRISVLEKETKEPFKQFSSGRRSRPGGMGGDTGGYDMMYDNMYMDDMGGRPY
ncbi:MAG: hypothetical protein JW837_08325 [Sedimentisphaerales bacterium]|nr:hypothetical protein [Sedimentisphaerales bacterium]